MRTIFQIRRRGWIVAAGILLVCAGMALFKDYLRVQNFHVIEPGAIYRGAEQKAGPLRWIMRHYGVRTVVCLVDPEPNEQSIVESQGARWVWLPLGESSLTATFDTLEEFGRLVVDPKNQPVFYHCRRGVYRSNLAHAVYRMRYCGWTLDQTLAELRAIGLDPDDVGGDRCCVEVIQKYYNERIVTPRLLRDDAARRSAN
jgi:protein tyrosine phosphatase (PTP) superfamily phosphohydrolase (DUF442 family)